MTRVAVVAHSRKTLGGGLPQLRRLLEDEGIEPLWHEVSKSRFAPAATKKALKAGAGLVFVWGGDGMVQRCADTLAGSGAALAIVPAGTANLLASNLDIPTDLEAAVQIGLHGRRRALDVGVLEGERFAVMAGAGFDSLVMQGADRGAKDRLGSLAYISSGVKTLRAERFEAKIEVDGDPWFDGEASCVLLGNVGTILGGLTVFDDARPDDGQLEIGVATAHGPVQWARVLTRAALGRTDRSPMVQVRRGREVDIRLDRKLPFQLDGGDRKAKKHLRARVEPGALLVCVPSDGSGSPEAV